MEALTADACRLRRGELNWAQARLAREADVSLSTVVNFEAGKRLGEWSRAQITDALNRGNR